MVRLKPGGKNRGWFDELPFPMDFKVRLWNITNPEEVQNGGKPIMQEVGPYWFQWVNRHVVLWAFRNRIVFSEWKVKYDQTDNDEDDTLEFTLRNTFYFKPELSNGLTGDEIVTIGHPGIRDDLQSDRNFWYAIFRPVMLGVSLAINVDRKPMLGLANKAMNEIFHNPTTPFWTGKAMDIMFNGIPLDCSSEDFNAQAVCNNFDGEDQPSFQPVDDTTYKFSFFGHVRVFHLTNSIYSTEKSSLFRWMPLQLAHTRFCEA